MRLPTMMTPSFASMHSLSSIEEEKKAEAKAPLAAVPSALAALPPKALRRATKTNDYHGILMPQFITSAFPYLVKLQFLIQSQSGL